jgi:hypothetical protein
LRKTTHTSGEIDETVAKQRQHIREELLYRAIAAYREDGSWRFRWKRRSTASAGELLAATRLARA